MQVQGRRGRRGRLGGFGRESGRTASVPSARAMNARRQSGGSGLAATALGPRAAIGEEGLFLIAPANQTSTAGPRLATSIPRYSYACMYVCTVPPVSVPSSANPPRGEGPLPPLPPQSPPSPARAPPQLVFALGRLSPPPPHIHLPPTHSRITPPNPPSRTPPRERDLYRRLIAASTPASTGTSTPSALPCGPSAGSHAP